MIVPESQQLHSSNVFLNTCETEGLYLWNNGRLELLFLRWMWSAWLVLFIKLLQKLVVLKNGWRHLSVNILLVLAEIQAFERKQVLYIVLPLLIRVMKQRFKCERRCFEKCFQKRGLFINWQQLFIKLFLDLSPVCAGFFSLQGAAMISFSLFNHSYSAILHKRIKQRSYEGLAVLKVVRHDTWYCFTTGTFMILILLVLYFLSDV